MSERIIGWRDPFRAHRRRRHNFGPRASRRLPARRLFQPQICFCLSAITLKREIRRRLSTRNDVKKRRFSLCRSSKIVFARSAACFSCSTAPPLHCGSLSHTHLWPSEARANANRADRDVELARSASSPATAPPKTTTSATTLAVASVRNVPIVASTQPQASCDDENDDDDDNKHSQPPSMATKCDKHAPAELNAEQPQSSDDDALGSPKQRARHRSVIDELKKLFEHPPADDARQAPTSGERRVYAVCTNCALADSPSVSPSPCVLDTRGCAQKGKSAIVKVLCAREFALADRRARATVSNSYERGRERAGRGGDAYRIFAIFARPRDSLQKQLRSVRCCLGSSGGGGGERDERNSRRKVFGIILRLDDTQTERAHVRILAIMTPKAALTPPIMATAVSCEPPETPILLDVRALPPPPPPPPPPPFAPPPPIVADPLSAIRAALRVSCARVRGALTPPCARFQDESRVMPAIERFLRANFAAAAATVAAADVRVVESPPHRHQHRWDRQFRVMSGQKASESAPPLPSNVAAARLGGAN